MGDACGLPLPDSRDHQSLPSWLTALGRIKCPEMFLCLRLKVRRCPEGRRGSIDCTAFGKLMPDWLGRQNTANGKPGIHTNPTDKRRISQPLIARFAPHNSR
jgi:hypothetical protein